MVFSNRFQRIGLKFTCTNDSWLRGPGQGTVMKIRWMLFGLLLCGLSGPLVAEPIEADQVRVIDGDTVRLFHRQPDVRLVGFNAPETKRAQCDTEHQLGDKATRRVRDLLRDGPLDFVAVACSCKAGTAGTRFCNYGRSCGTLKVAGKDVGEILIAEGLAVPFQCYATSCPRRRARGATVANPES
jgi:endonuclease YncB( thermonuclease family)